MPSRDVLTALLRLAAAQHGLLSRRQALDAGASERFVRSRVESRIWEVVEREVYRVAGAPETWQQRVLAVVLAAGDGGVASHRTAAVLWGLPGFREGSIDLIRPRQRTRRAFERTTGESRVLPSHHRTVVDGIPVTTVARTVFDLAAILHPGRVERALDNSLAMGLATIADHRRVLDDLGKRGRRGTRLMRELLAARGADYVAPASELEARFLRLVADFGLPVPEREVVLGDADGVVGRVEFVYRDAGVLVELDGRRHHMVKLDFEADRARDNRFTAAGWRVARLTWEMVTARPAETVALLRRTLGAAA